jgi:hypothetical protein
MDSAAQLMMSSRETPDLRNINLEDLAGQARNGDESVQEIVDRMVEDGHSQPALSFTNFNSAIG